MTRIHQIPKKLKNSNLLNFMITSSRQPQDNIETVLFFFLLSYLTCSQIWVSSVSCPQCAGQKSAPRHLTAIPDSHTAKKNRHITAIPEFTYCQQKSTHHRHPGIHILPTKITTIVGSISVPVIQCPSSPGRRSTKLHQGLEIQQAYLLVRSFLLQLPLLHPRGFFCGYNDVYTSELCLLLQDKLQEEGRSCSTTVDHLLLFTN